MPSLILNLPWRKPSSTDASATLLRAAQSGDPEALDILLNRYRNRILNLCFQVLQDRDLAEDAAQESFVRAFQHIPKFRNDADFGTWLYRLTLNHCLERKRQSARRLELAPHSDLTEDILAPNDHQRASELKLAVESALASLPDPLRLVLVLRQWHDLSYDEIGNILKVPTGTVRSRLHEARRRVREYWEDAQ